jgi:hypothetical protein
MISTAYPQIRQLLEGVALKLCRCSAAAAALHQAAGHCIAQLLQLHNLAVLT